MIDWYYDKLPGNAFASALHQLRAKGDVVRATALGGAMPIYYILGHQALAEAFRDAEHFPPGHAYQIISLPFIGETFMSMNEDQHRVWRPPMTHSFRRHVIDQMDQHQLARIGHDILDLLDGQRETDLVPSFTRRYAFRVICHQLGLPIEPDVWRQGPAKESGCR
jgi:cytochrome P450